MVYLYKQWFEFSRKEVFKMIRTGDQYHHYLERKCTIYDKAYRKGRPKNLQVHENGLCEIHHINQ